MRLRTHVLVAAVLVFAIPGLAGAQVRVGATASYSLLERQDTSGSGTWYRDEVTLGRSWLVGGTIDVQFGDSDYLTFDGTYGPYHNDTERNCYQRHSDPTPCQPQESVAGAGSLAIGVHYVRTFGSGRWRPYLGGGGGIKNTWYRYADWWGDAVSAGSYSLSASVGAELRQRFPLRLELRTVYLTDSMLAPGSGRWELQARATFFLTRFGGFHTPAGRQTEPASTIMLKTRRNESRAAGRQPQGEA